MIETGLIAGLGLAGALLAFAFWQAVRAARMSDRLIDAIREHAQLEVLYAARGTAIEERDRVITTLEDGNRRLRAALEVSQNALPVPSPDATAKDSVNALRSALDGLGDLARAGASSVPTKLPGLPPAPGLKDR